MLSCSSFVLPTHARLLRLFVTALRAYAACATLVYCSMHVPTTMQMHNSQYRRSCLQHATLHHHARACGCTQNTPPEQRGGCHSSFGRGQGSSSRMSSLCIHLPTDCIPCKLHRQGDSSPTNEPSTHPPITPIAEQRTIPRGVVGYLTLTNSLQQTVRLLSIRPLRITSCIMHPTAPFVQHPSRARNPNRNIPGQL